MSYLHDLAEERAKLRLAQASLARKNPATFCEFVLRDEQTGKPITLAPMHEAWHDLLSHEARVVIWGHPESGKSAQVSVGRVLWELGRNPNLRIAVISATENLAKKLIATIRSYIERSEELHLVFPKLRARPANLGQPWSAMALTVDRTVLAKDPSVYAAGAGSNILGGRVDLLIFEDVLTYKNTRTQAQLDETYRWITGTPFGRLTANARVWAMANAWNPSDAMERLVSERGFVGRRFPVQNDLGESNWPEFFPESRLKKIRRDLGAVEYARQMLCVSRDESTARFKREWIETGLAQGRGYRFVSSVESAPAGYSVWHGVDLAVSRKKTADLTSFFTGLLHPDGRRQLLNLESGRWSGPDIVRRIDDLSVRFGGIFVVENVAAQDYVLQFARELTRAQLRPFTTGANKADPLYGVESLAAELEDGQWILPSPDVSGAPLEPEVDALVKELVGYHPSKHTGDRIMAMWFCREGMRSFERKNRLGKKPKEAGEAGFVGGVRVF